MRTKEELLDHITHMEDRHERKLKEAEENATVAANAGDASGLSHWQSLVRGHQFALTAYQSVRELIEED